MYVQWTKTNLFLRQDTSISSGAMAPHPAFGDPQERARALVLLEQGFGQMIPHNAALGLRFLDFDLSSVTIALPFREEFVGDPERGVIHGGVITTLLDAASGAAVYVRMWRPMPIATLDLRIDYLRPATPGGEVVAHAECYHVTQNVAFTRATAFHAEARDKPIAMSLGTFMLDTPGKSVAGSQVSRKVAEGAM